MTLASRKFYLDSQLSCQSHHPIMSTYHLVTLLQPAPADTRWHGNSDLATRSWGQVVIGYCLLLEKDREDVSTGRRH